MGLYVSTPVPESPDGTRPSRPARRPDPVRPASSQATAAIGDARGRAMPAENFTLAHAMPPPGRGPP